MKSPFVHGFSSSNVIGEIPGPLYEKPQDLERSELTQLAQQLADAAAKSMDMTAGGWGHSGKVHHGKP